VADGGVFMTDLQQHIKRFAKREVCITRLRAEIERLREDNLKMKLLISHYEIGEFLDKLDVWESESGNKKLVVKQNNPDQEEVSDE
jgi:hypothetical protein